MFLGGSASNLQGWQTEVVRRTGGLTQGFIDVYYHSNKNRKYRYIYLHIYVYSCIYENRYMCIYIYICIYTL
jgi:hypothetical protein